MKVPPHLVRPELERLTDSLCKVAMAHQRMDALTPVDLTISLMVLATLVARTCGCDGSTFASLSADVWRRCDDLVKGEMQ